MEGIFIPAIIFFSIFGFLAWHRYIEYKETVELAKHGLVKPRPPSDGRGALRWGIVFAALGLALCVGLYPLGVLFTRNSDLSFPLGFGPWMLMGLLPLFLGLGLILIYLVTRPAPGAAPTPAPLPRQRGRGYDGMGEAAGVGADWPGGALGAEQVGDMVSPEGLPPA